MLTSYQQNARRHGAAAGAINRFALDLYARLKAGRGNLLFSPFSVYQALYLAYAGAAGETAEQMADGLHWGLDQRDDPPFIHLDLGADETAPFAAASGAWAQRDRGFRPEYVDRVTRVCGGDFFEVDFVHAPEHARHAINRWAGERTGGKIPDLVPPGAVGERTSLLLTSAVHLDATWDQRFDPADTRTAPFRLATGGRVPVPMMHRRASLLAVDEDDFLMVHLPCEGHRASLQVYVPRDPADFGWLERTLLKTGPDSLLREALLHDVTLSLPRFSLRADLALGPLLSGMGMPDAFGPEAADFSGIARPSGCRVGTDLFLSQLLQKTLIEVDEFGTRAAAATASALVTGAPPPPPPLVVKVDQPFLFTLCASSPRYRAPVLLFMGRVQDPTVSDAAAPPLGGKHEDQNPKHETNSKHE